MPMKNSSDTSWDRNTDLPICSTAPEPLSYHGPPYLCGYFLLFHPVALCPRRQHALRRFVCCRSAIITCAVELFKFLIKSAGSVKDLCNTEFDGILPDAVTNSDIENRTRDFEN